MPHSFASVLLALVLVVAPLHAQEFAWTFDPRSGDAWVDAQLADVNAYGTRWPAPFADELVRYQGAPRDLVDALLRQRWAPGDIYFACALAQASGRPCRAVAEEWSQHHDEGWGALAQRLGIAPGSPAFHQLKRGFVPSYDRWGRPIQLDATLRSDFPGRGGEPPAPPPGHGAGKPSHAPAEPPGQQKKAKGHGHGHG